MNRTNTRTPHGLGDAGKALFRRVVAAYELRQDELVVLQMACAGVDTVERLTVELAGQPLVVPGVGGQDRVNPLLVEIRQQRITVAAMLKQLGLPDEGAAGVSKAGARSVQARAAANVRWGRGGSGKGA